VQLAARAWQAILELDRAEAAAAPLRRLADATKSAFVTLLADHAASALTGDHAGLLELADEWEARDALRLAAAAAATAARALRGGRTATAARARADELVRRCGGLNTPVVRSRDVVSPLTPCEREIAALAAAGATRKIAAQLFLSSRTVDNHVQSVNIKLGISGRHELAGR
jgi:DNA-binding CsgD family transcriptional regulator